MSFPLIVWDGFNVTVFGRQFFSHNTTFSHVYFAVKHCCNDALQDKSSLEILKKNNNSVKHSLPDLLKKTHVSVKASGSLM